MPADQTPTQTAEEIEASRFTGGVVEDGVEQPKADAPAPAKVTAPAKAPVPQPDEPEDEDDGATAAPEPKRSAQERINQAVGKQRAAERALAAMEAHLAALEAPKAVPQTDLTQKTATTTIDPNSPKPSDYRYGELDAKYIADVARYEVRKEIAADRAATRAEADKKTQKDQAAEFEAAVQTFTETGAQKYPDFAETVIASAAANEWPLSRTLGDLLMGSEFGPDIAYTLAKDVTEAKRIFALTPEKQAAWFGRQEGTLASASPDEAPKPAPKVTQAPAPLTTKLRPGGSPQPVTADTTDFAAFEALAFAKRQ